MRRQDLITALVRNPDHTVLVDGNAVTGLDVVGTTIVLHIASRAQQAAPAASDQGALEAARVAHVQELARVREEDRVAAEAEITNLRETLGRENASVVEKAVAESLAAERSGHEAAIREAVELAVAAAKGEGAQQ